MECLREGCSEEDNVHMQVTYWESAFGKISMGTGEAEQEKGRH